VGGSSGIFEPRDRLACEGRPHGRSHSGLQRASRATRCRTSGAGRRCASALRHVRIPRGSKIDPSTSRSCAPAAKALTRQDAQRQPGVLTFRARCQLI
jgi:hypothetical protein